MALCSLLAFWRGDDAWLLDRLFRKSRLLRETWDERRFADGSTYGEMTIERAIAGTSEFYEPGNVLSLSEKVTCEARRRNRVRTCGDHMSRISGLEQQLTDVAGLKEALEAELADEPAKRLELEMELEAVRDGWVSIFDWFR